MMGFEPIKIAFEQILAQDEDRVAEVMQFFFDQGCCGAATPAPAPGAGGSCDVCKGTTYVPTNAYEDPTNKNKYSCEYLSDLQELIPQLSQL